MAKFHGTHFENLRLRERYGDLGSLLYLCSNLTCFACVFSSLFLVAVLLEGVINLNTCDVTGGLETSQQFR
ncbi:unnamed protein product [Camellia sinensis]